MQADVDATYYFDPGVSYVLSVTNLSLDCAFSDPPENREMTLVGYSTNSTTPLTGAPIQWKYVPILVPPLAPGETLAGRWNGDIPPGSPRTPLDQRELKFDMHARYYVMWLEWKGVRISDIVPVRDTDYP